MKRLLTLLLATALSVTVCAAPHPRRPLPRHRRPRPTPHPPRCLKNVPWQLVLAGGAAVSGVVFAYKVSDGIQQGTVETARANPEGFAEAIGGFGGTVRAVCALIVVVCIGCLAWRLAPRRHRDHSPPDRRHQEPPIQDDEPAQSTAKGMD